jgi:hypothetical protein
MNIGVPHECLDNPLIKPIYIAWRGLKSVAPNDLPPYGRPLVTHWKSTHRYSRKRPTRQAHVGRIEKSFGYLISTTFKIITPAGA